MLASRQVCFTCRSSLTPIKKSCSIQGHSQHPNCLFPWCDVKRQALLGSTEYFLSPVGSTMSLPHLPCFPRTGPQSQQACKTGINAPT